MAYEDHLNSNKDPDRRNILFAILIAGTFLLMALVYFLGRDDNNDSTVSTETVSPVTNIPTTNP